MLNLDKSKKNLPTKEQVLQLCDGVQQILLSHQFISAIVACNEAWISKYGANMGEQWQKKIRKVVMHSTIHFWVSMIFSHTHQAIKLSIRDHLTILYHSPHNFASPKLCIAEDRSHDKT
jgi:hypothetical protein